MFFKNLVVFTFNEPFALSDADLQEKLAQQVFRPCGTHEPTAIGWTPVIKSEHDTLTHTLQGYTLLCLKIQERIVPATVVNEKLAERIEALEAAESRKIGKKEKEGLKEDVYSTLLPQAFCKSKKIFCYIDTANQRLLIDTASSNIAEQVTTHLRKTLGSLKVQHPATVPPGLLMATWLKTGDYPTDLVIEDSCTLKAQNGDEVSSIKCQGHDLLSHDIRNFIQNGVSVTQLSLSWQDQLAFQLTDEFAIRSIKFLEGLKSLNNDVQGDALAQFDADFILMAETFSDFITRLLTLFGETTAETKAA